MAHKTRSKARDDQSARLAPKVWERHRKMILELYETHSLGEVMSFMEKQHDFKASKMAYKKKLGRWKTNKKQPEASQEDEEQPDEQAKEVSAVSAPLRLVDAGAPGFNNKEISNVLENFQRFIGNRAVPAEHSRTAEETTEDVFQGHINPGRANKLPNDRSSAARTQTSDNDTNDLAPATIEDDESDRPQTSAPSRVDSPAYWLPESEVAPEGRHKVLQLGRLHEQFFGTLFGVSTLPPFCEVIGTLASLFDQYANTKDIFQLERILSLYDFMLVPSNPVRLKQVIRFCRIASKSEELKEEHARLFVRTMDALADKASVSGPSWDLPDDVETAATFWLAGHLDGDKLLDVVAKISRFYAHDRPGLCPGVEPYLVLAKLGKTEDEGWDYVTWACLEKILKAVHDRIKSTPLSDEEDRFATEFFMFLWTRQQGNKTFNAESSLANLLEGIIESKHPSAKFHSIILHCLAMQGAIRKIDHFPIWDFFLSKSFVVMEGLVKSITTRDCLQLVQDMLCSLSTDIKKRQEWLQDDMRDLAPTLRKKLATLSWEVVCAITEGGFPDSATQSECPNRVERLSREIAAG
ncbi:hypothetical protein MMC10_006711 [Thelotrema lepadinum]|nr:hypothetical protein [Thelotrema lepadinum]